MGMASKWMINTIVALGVLAVVVDSARILAVIPTISKSHHIWNRSLILALAKRGHHITVLSPDPEKNPLPNVKYINLEGSYERLGGEFELERMVEDNAIERMKVLWEWGLVSCGYQSTTKGYQELLNLPRDSFEMIIMETVLNECMYVFLHHFGGGSQIPVVGISAFGTSPWIDLITGEKILPSVFPIPVVPYLSHMTFWERLSNFIVTGYTWAGVLYYYYPTHQLIAEKAYGKPIPPLAELGSNISVFLVNSHFLINGPQARLPGVVEVGALHCSPPNRLPLDIDSFLNKSETGAIYFSLGGNVQSELLPKEKLQTIIEAFSTLGPKIRILWKFDPNVYVHNLPPNILMKKWLPQQDVLGHNKVKLFISHGGLLSTQESIYHGVPLIGMPFFADQYTNVRRLKEMEVAQEVNLQTMTKESFSKAILDVFNDPKYHNNAQKMSKILQDQPQTPLERAIFWTEFLLRQNVSRIQSLRTAGLDLNWFQYFLLDVLFFILLCTFLTLGSLILMIVLLFKKIQKLITSKTYNKKLKRK